MSAADDGIDVMRARMERGQRTPPAPPRSGRPGARSAEHGAGRVIREGVEEQDAPVEGASSVGGRDAGRGNVRVDGVGERRTRRVALRPGDPHVNLAIRVRRPLDDQLAEVLHRLRRADIRSSKVELIEMLLWEMPADVRSLRNRLAAFREAAPRGGDALTS